MSSKNRYITLCCPCNFRVLETPCVYNKVTDELYELGDEAVLFLKKCDGTLTLDELGGDPEFLSYCFKEHIIGKIDYPHRRYFNIAPSPTPSLRYLELHLTNRCNLKCRHCYLGDGASKDINLLAAFKVFDEFNTMQGLRMLVTGGEPLLHPGFWYMNERIQDYGFRGILLSNGTLITKDVASRLKFHEVQVSIDGMEESHDKLRGQGAFKATIHGIENLAAAGIKVSAATMVTSVNRDDFDQLGKLMDSLGVTEWAVDVPSPAGRLKENLDLLLPPEEAAPYLSYGFGAGHHESPAGYGCGAHLCAVGTEGQVAKCGYYLDNPVGYVFDGLGSCWEKVAPISLESLECDCEYKDACKGGCRFRAASYTDAYGPDPVRCHQLGVCNIGLKGGDRVDYKEGGKRLFRSM
jgi:radical SAM protein with 4Fe4S-binding SPASM domain